MQTCSRRPTEIFRYWAKWFRWRDSLQWALKRLNLSQRSLGRLRVLLVRHLVRTLQTHPWLFAEKKNQCDFRCIVANDIVKRAFQITHLAHGAKTTLFFGARPAHVGVWIASQLHMLVQRSRGNMRAFDACHCGNTSFSVLKFVRRWERKLRFRCLGTEGGVCSRNGRKQKLRNCKQGCPDALSHPLASPLLS